MENDFVEDDSYTYPSFSCYSSNRLADIAIRVAAEDQEFEFALFQDEKDTLSNKFTQNGPMFPVFDRTLTPNFNENEQSDSCKMMVPLGKLLMEEREEHVCNYAPSCSSSDEDNKLENTPEGTYCLWRPKPAETTHPPSMCKKSMSTGSASKRWKFPDFTKRSNSEGKDSFVFLTPKNHETRVPEKETRIKVAKGKVAGGIKRLPSAHEALYVKNRAEKEENKKKSYLPYRQGLVGFSAVYERFW